MNAGTTTELIIAVGVALIAALVAGALLALLFGAPPRNRGDWN